MDIFDLIDWLLMAYLLGLLGGDNGGTIDLVFVGDAIPGTINAH